MDTVFNLDLANQTNLNILLADHVTVDEKWKRSFLTSSPYSRIYYIKDGEGYLKTAERTIELKPGNVYLIPTGCMLSFGCTYLEKIFFHVNLFTLEKYDLFSKTNDIYSMPFKEEEYERLSKCILFKSYEDILYVKTVLMQILSKFANDFSLTKTPAKKYDAIVQDIIKIVHEEAKINLSVSDIANRFFVSESQVRNIFLREMGMPIGKYIDDMVFIKARHLLAQHQLSIAEISSMLGFCDQFYFSRRFKQKFGETPSQFKKNNTNEPYAIKESNSNFTKYDRP